MTYTCPLCSFSFSSEEMIQGGCAACPTSPRSCGLAKCPACGYEWPEESSSKIVGLLRNLLGTKGVDR